jgi:hypothetical protein
MCDRTSFSNTIVKYFDICINGRVKYRSNLASPPTPCTKASHEEVMGKLKLFPYRLRQAMTPPGRSGSQDFLTNGI